MFYSEIMKFLAILVLATATFANAAPDGQDMSDKDMFLGIIACARQAILNGEPDIGIPSHNPLLISRNFTQSLDVALQTFKIDLENMYMDGLAVWEVRQMDDVTEVEGVPVFNYAIYWPLIKFTGTLRFSVIDRLTNVTKSENEGEFGFEFDHITFSGQFTFTKPAEGKEAGFNDLDLHFHTEESKVHVDGLGILSNLVELVGGPLLTELVNLDLVSVGSSIKDRLNTKWVADPERIQKMIDNCDKGF